MAIGQPPGRDRFAGFLAEHALVAHSSGPAGTHIGLSASFPIKVRLPGFIILIPSIQYRPNFPTQKSFAITTHETSTRSFRIGDGGVGDITGCFSDGCSGYGALAKRPIEARFPGGTIR
jgi:hypothetical protein